jgi:macrophage erythroblast attacher
VRTQEEGKMLEAISHAKKYLLPSKDLYPQQVNQAAGLLAFPPSGRVTVYKVKPSFSAFNI